MAVAEAYKVPRNNFFCKWSREGKFSLPSGPPLSFSLPFPLPLHFSYPFPIPFSTSFSSPTVTKSPPSRCSGGRIGTLYTPALGVCVMYKEDIGSCHWKEIFIGICVSSKITNANWSTKNQADRIELLVPWRGWVWALLRFHWEICTCRRYTVLTTVHKHWCKVWTLEIKLMNIVNMEIRNCIVQNCKMFRISLQLKTRINMPLHVSPPA